MEVILLPNYDIKLKTQTADLLINKADKPNFFAELTMNSNVRPSQSLEAKRYLEASRDLKNCNTRGKDYTVNRLSL